MILADKSSDILIHLQGSQAAKRLFAIECWSDILIHLQGSQAHPDKYVSMMGLTSLFTYKVLKLNTMMEVLKHCLTSLFTYKVLKQPSPCI